MTVKGYGLGLVEFLREKNTDGTPDWNYVGRTIRLMPTSGGEILLQLTPTELSRLAQACNETLEGLVHTQNGWQCVDAMPRKGALQ